MLIGLGKQIKKTVPQGPFTVSFSIYDTLYPATQTGDAPQTFTKMAGETFIIPDEGNIERTEIRYFWQYPGPMQQIPTDIPLRGWSDGNGLYLPGDTYTVTNSDVTLSAIWNTLYAPNMVDSQPYTVSVGDTVTITGTGLGSTEYVTFDRFYDSPNVTILSDTRITAVVPEGISLGSGTIVISTINGGGDFIYDAYEAV